MKDVIESTPLWYRLVLLFNIILVVVSFVLPPVGIIDSSVITAVGEIGIMAFLGMFPKMIGKGKSFTVSKGNTTVSVSSHKDDEFMDGE